MAVAVVELDAQAVEAFLKHFSAYGFWGVLALVFVLFGMQHLAPIINAIATWHNERHKANLSHERSMLKLKNKLDQDKSGKLK